MLTIFGKRQRFCDGVGRRDFLKIGALTAAGFGLGDLFRAEAAAGIGSSSKAIINLFLSGGPSHLDTWDLKPDAPREIRGEYHPIKTNVGGMEICHLMPKLATMADKYALIRSLSGFRDEHNSFQTETGWTENELKSIGGHPSFGSCVSKVQGVCSGPSPTFVALSGDTRQGFLGPQYAAFRPDGPGRANLKLEHEITVDRFNNRQQLLGELDRVRRDVDASHMMQAMDSFNQRATNLILSGKVAQALDIGKEDDKVKALYGLKEPNHQENEGLLIARRLIEQGVRCVSVSNGGWDTHTGNFTSLNQKLPTLDWGLSGLITDLDNRGMLGNVAIVVWGEFGRTPRVNPSAGRDHWANACSAFVAGGGMRGGQVIGATNRYAEAPVDRPVHLREVFATMYHLMGIDASRTTIVDPNGRPQYLVDNREPIRELI